MRCLALAAQLASRGNPCHFICRAHAGHIGARIEAEGHRLTLLPLDHSSKGGPGSVNDDYQSWLGGTWQVDAEQTRAVLGTDMTALLVVDHYALDGKWESALKPNTQTLLAIDDLANRSHSCDFLLDHNAGRVAADYTRFLPGQAICLAGPEFALLRPEFLAARGERLGRACKPRILSVLVNMGGVDHVNATSMVLRALRNCGLSSDCQISVVLGLNAPWLSEVVGLAGQSALPCQVMVDVQDMASLAASSDIAIGSAGVAALERCCVGLPSVLVVLAENQRPGALALHAAGVAELIESLDEIEVALPRKLASLDCPERRSAASAAAAKLVDGRGVDRVLDALGFNQ
ncbi:MAG: UDP-2,4-diacetamido-2,4,6-trideoxy-beta-L-altropyranose hydrolase [Gammaproteobacteria bacterium RIFCSPHIGHO2_12_FULL_63_22]|nr:MAG: UDP-2,4-diacetamido-2,4,6-trideoxy-beta-L-altropyranose hydrolase [Gammaproteobacteria bacterium RIFCSPHIGHO2_12_FULL_63_22]